MVCNYLTQKECEQLSITAEGQFVVQLPTAQTLAYPVAPAALLESWQDNSLDEPIGTPVVFNKTTTMTADWSHSGSADYVYTTLPEHIRRLRMMADLVMHEVRRKLILQDHVTILDIGPGDLALECLLRQSLATNGLATKVSIVAADINPDILKAGLSCKLLDRTIEWDWSHERLALAIDTVGGDILVFGEVLEHIPHSIGAFAATEISAAKGKYNVSIVGSVPNALQLCEVAGYLTGKQRPHQLGRYLQDTSYGHISHFSYASLVEFLQVAGYEDKRLYIASNGIEIRQNSMVLSYAAGLVYPHLGPRLIFLAEA